MSQAESDSKKSFFKRTRDAQIAFAMSAALFASDAMLFNYAGLNKVLNTIGVKPQAGDGSDGYVVFANYALANESYQKALRDFKANEDKFKNDLFSGIEAATKLKQAKTALESNRSQFLSQLQTRTKIENKELAIVGISSELTNNNELTSKLIVVEKSDKEPAPVKLPDNVFVIENK